MAVMPPELQKWLMEKTPGYFKNINEFTEYFRNEYMSAFSMNYILKPTIDQERRMLEEEAYRKFMSIVEGPVNRDHFASMMWDEAEHIAQMNNGRRIHADGKYVPEALDRMIEWYRNGMETAQRIAKLGPADFVAISRRAYVWCSFLRMSHESDFNLIAWFATHLPKP